MKGAIIEILIQPIGKPRQTVSDRWKQRPCVLRYRAFADEIRHQAKKGKLEIKDSLNATFIIQMPKSWSKKKKVLMEGKPHLQKPDIDNIAKAVMDSLLKEDSYIHRLNCEKIWGYEGKIIFH